MKTAVYIENKQDFADIYNTLRDYSNYHTPLDVRKFSTLAEVETAVSDGKEFSLSVLGFDTEKGTCSDFADTVRNMSSHSDVILICGEQSCAAKDDIKKIIRLAPPVSKDELKSTVNVILNKNAGDNAFLTIFTPRGEKNVKLSDIMYVEVLGHILRFALENHTQIHSKVLRIPLERAASPLFHDKRFLRPHRSYLVNADYIERITRSEVHMNDGMVIPLSRLKIDEMRHNFQAHQSGKNI